MKTPRIYYVLQHQITTELRHSRPKTKNDNMQTELPKTETLAAVASSDLLCHDHDCYCGTATHTPHKTGEHGCVRAMTEAPIPSGTHETLGCPMWEVAGHRITDFSLRQQRGYHQHHCGCWSWSQDSTNSIEA